MRVSKPHEERKNEILDVSEKLFINNGYDKTSVNQILEKVGIAKGTFYYYFKSKEEVMDSIIERYNERYLKIAQMNAADKTLNIHERLLKTLMSIQVKENQDIEILNEIHKPQNALMHQKMMSLMVRGLTPILTDIVEDGIKEKIFDTPYPQEVVEMIIIYVNAAFDEGIVEVSMDNIERKIKAFITNIERLLGAEKGSLSYILNLFEGNK